MSCNAAFYAVMSRVPRLSWLGRRGLRIRLVAQLVELRLRTEYSQIGVIG
jgi:hypothetical protein